jgi:HD-GYP domain-containing protein (c-di-GMP phosphodiesterase class II)
MILEALSLALYYRDRFTLFHSERVLGLSCELGAACGLTSAEMKVLSVAAAFHDIGKIGIPDEVLFKPQELTTAERAIMQGHSEIGQKIIQASAIENSDEVTELIRHHHEQYDGLGYPDGLAGQLIPLGSRIIAVADCYDAMAALRPYHPIKPHNQILEILREEMGWKHDSEVLTRFFTIIEHSRFRAMV